MPALIEPSRYLAQAFVAGLWQGMVLVAAVALLLRFAPGLSATARYVIWWCAFALGALTPLLHIPSTAILSIHSAAVQLRIGAGWGLAIAAVWTGFMVIRAVQLMMQAKHLHRIWKQATPIAAETGICNLMRKVSPTAQLCTSDDVASPSVIGFFSPRLLILSWLFAKLTPSELEQIVLHESEHLRRRDDWTNLLQKVSLVLFPLNPALLWMDRRLNLERELACDAGVVASTKSPFDYARCLTRLAEHRLLHRGIGLSLSAWGRRSELARRVHDLLKPGGSSPRWKNLYASALICIGLIVGGVGMAGSPHLIAFTDAAGPAIQAADTVAIPQSVRPIPVVYQPTTKAHPVLLKAVAAPDKAHRARHKLSPRAQLHTVRATVKQPPPRLILTTFTLQTDRLNGVRPPSLPSLPPPYATVQFEDGWLVIQL